MRGLATQRRLTACYGVKGHNKNLLTFLYFLTIAERGVALSTSTATAYKYSVAGHLSFGAPKCEKAQKSSGFWANRTYRLCIKDNVLIDPACGTSGFLVTSGDYLREKYKKEVLLDKKNRNHFMNDMFHGYDMDRTMLRIGAMNMVTHGVENPFIEYRDSLSDQNPDKDMYSLILANPPFKGNLDTDTVSADFQKVCKTKKTELLFLTLFVRMLKIGGRCACIVPDGVLFGSSNAHKAIRKELVENQRLEAVISMPSGVFKPYAGVSTGILIFTKAGHDGTDDVWFYDMTADGFSLDDKRTEIKENDIPDIINRFKNLEAEKDRKRTEKSFMVSKKEIADNDYVLFRKLNGTPFCTLFGTVFAMSA